MQFEEFKNYLWAYISPSIISIKDREIDNRDFWDSICYDAFRMYEQSDVELDLVCKMCENMLFAINRYKPMLNFY